MARNTLPAHIVHKTAAVNHDTDYADEHSRLAESGRCLATPRTPPFRLLPQSRDAGSRVRRQTVEVSGLAFFASFIAHTMRPDHIAAQPEVSCCVTTI